VELMLDAIRDKVVDGKRLDREDGRWLLDEAPLLEVGALAEEVRFRRIPERRVTFVIDSNPNYTNVCVTDCQFCAFYRKPGDAEAWTLPWRNWPGRVAARPGRRFAAPGYYNPSLPPSTTSTSSANAPALPR
jgi:cyclic dehypoxanthinyl futalosine synthase